jgi:hypothetical protein
MSYDNGWLPTACAPELFESFDTGDVARQERQLAKA